jgi:hypothetical protein
LATALWISRQFFCRRFCLGLSSAQSRGVRPKPSSAFGFAPACKRISTVDSCP